MERRILAFLSVLVLILSLAACGGDIESSGETDESGALEEDTAADLLEVTFSVSMQGTAGRPAFKIKTSLPDETVLMLTVKDANNETFQSKVTIEDGAAESEQFGSDSKPVADKFSLGVSMSSPQLQSDSVRAVIGENGENLSGEYVIKSDSGSEQLVSATFAYDFSDNGSTSTKNTVADMTTPEPSATAPPASEGTGDNGSNFNTYNNPDQQKTSSSYVLNTSTMKFHYPSCNSVEKIAPENYSTSSQSRDTLISQGYDPCGKCHP